MNIGAASSLTGLTCATGYYHYNFGSATASTPVNTVTAASTCQACPNNAFSCKGTVAALTSAATIICKSGYTLIGSGWT